MKKGVAIMLLLAMLGCLGGCAGTSNSQSEQKWSATATTEDVEQIVEVAENEDVFVGQEPEGDKAELIDVISNIIDRAKYDNLTLELWDGTIAESFAGGDGSFENPYQISNGKELAKRANDVNSGFDFQGKFFVLTSDILLNDISMWNYSELSDMSFTDGWQTWKPIGVNVWNAFSGHFDGCDHVVLGVFNTQSYYYNSYEDHSLSYVGLFGRVNKGTVSNVTVACCALSPRAEHVGGIAGRCDDGKISNCNVYQSFISNSAQTIQGLNSCSVGGLCGYSTDSIIENSTTSAYVSYGCAPSAGISIGGVVGSGDSIINCYSNSAVLTWIGLFSEDSNGYDFPGVHVGGICGKGFEINNCYNESSITVIASVLSTGEAEDVPYVRVGGIAGGCAGEISNCASNGTIHIYGEVEETDVGGIAGLLGNARRRGIDDKLSEGHVSFSYAKDSIMATSSSAHIGGISGAVCGNISVTNSYYAASASNKAVGELLLTPKNRFGSGLNYVESSLFTDQVKSLGQEELRDKNSYYNWDFENVWAIDHQRYEAPILQKIDLERIYLIIVSTPRIPDWLLETTLERPFPVF